MPCRHQTLPCLQRLRPPPGPPPLLPPPPLCCRRSPLHNRCRPHAPARKSPCPLLSPGWSGLGCPSSRAAAPPAPQLTRAAQRGDSRPASPCGSWSQGSGEHAARRDGERLRGMRASLRVGCPNERSQANEIEVCGPARCAMTNLFICIAAAEVLRRSPGRGPLACDRTAQSLSPFPLSKLGQGRWGLFGACC